MFSNTSLLSHVPINTAYPHFLGWKCQNVPGFVAHSVVRTDVCVGYNTERNPDKRGIQDHMWLQLWHFDGFGGENDVPTKWTLVMLNVF